jgi:tetratricopeptide (TPR) repeat protein
VGKKKRKKTSGKKSDKLSVGFYLVGTVLVLSVILFCLTKIRDADTWWHLKTGQLIFESGIPRVDPFSHVIGGQPWIAFEWLSQALFYQLFDIGGAAALTGFKALVLVGTFLLAWRSRPEKPYWSAVLTLLAAMGMRLYFVERPFIFDYFFLSALGCVFWNVRFDHPPAQLKWALPLGTLLWANLHDGAALLAPALITAGALAEYLRNRRTAIGFWMTTAVFSGAALLVNPHGAAILTHFAGTVQFSAKDLITEWHAPTWEFKGIYGLFLLGGAYAARDAFSKRPFAAAWLIVLGIASLQMKRNIPLFLIAAVPAIAAAIPEFTLWERYPKLRKAAPFLVAMGMLAVGWVHTNVVYAHLRPYHGIGTELVFEGAFDFLDKHNVRGKMFNEYKSGGPIIWQAGPERKVFVDGRSLEYGPKHVRSAIQWYRPETWKALDEEFNFDYAVVRRHGWGAYTTRVLDALPQWRLVYWDDESMVYLKQTPANKDLIAKSAYRLLMPGRSNMGYIEGYVRSETVAKELLFELKRSLDEVPENTNALLMLSYVLARSGDMTGAEKVVRRAIKAHPSHAQPRHTLGWILSVQGDLDGASRAYSGALSRLTRPEMPGLGGDILNNLGRIREKQGDMQGAARYYRKALKYNPKQKDALHNLKKLGT